MLGTKRWEGNSRKDLERDYDVVLMGNVEKKENRICKMSRPKWTAQCHSKKMYNSKSQKYKKLKEVF